MAIKKAFDFKNPIFIGSMIVSIGVVFTFLAKVVDFCRIPDAVAAESKRIDKLEETTNSITEILKEQKTINDYIHKQDMKQEKAKEDEPILSPDGKFFMDKETGKWKKVVKHE